nr:hypothetical protein BaRGS_020963 [Batillaria attramentaria]
MERDEIYEQGVLKSIKLFEWSRKYKWDDDDFELASRLANHDISMSLQHAMFIPAIERLASDTQKAKWLPRALHYEMIGTYAQTELGHVGKSSNTAIVLAQLIVKGKNHGLHPFLVPLRSMEDHTPLPGISVGDIGPKMALNCIDNGFLIMKNVRIPRENMFMKNAEVTRDGRFISRGVDKANYATMVLVRVKITRWAFESLSDGATTAVRYSVVRRQSSLKPGERELQVLDYQSQQYKVLPALAASYAFLMTNRSLHRLYDSVHADIMAGNTKLLAELHCQSSALKAYMSEVVVQLLELCRQACGGHGYLASSGIGLLCASSAPLVTVEGENSVLYQQAARYLMKQVAKAVVGDPVASGFQYLLTQSSSDRPDIRIQNLADCGNLDTLLQVYQRMAFSVVTGAARKLQMAIESGVEQHVAWNNNMVSLIQAARAHSQLYVVEAFVDAVRNLSQTASHGVTAVLTAVCQFYALHGIAKEAGYFLATPTLTPDQFELVRAAELQAMAKVRFTQPTTSTFEDWFTQPTTSTFEDW